MEQSTAPLAPEPEMGTVGRLVNVLLSPGRAFESIGRKPGWDWIVPVILLLAAGIAASSVIGPRIDVDGAVKEQVQRIERMQPQMSEQDREKVERATRKNMETWTRGWGRFVSPGFFLIPLFLVPLFYHGIAAAWGKKTTYMTVVAGYSWVQVVQILKSVLFTIVAIPKQDVSLKAINGLLKSNLGAFLDPETTSMTLMTLATNVDVFEIWAVILGSIALAKTTRLSLKAAATTVVGFRLLWLAVQLIGALIAGAFGG
jgi:hypothetical protein